MNTISVIVPAYNCGRYIKKCIESILNQSYQDIELILVDDQSNDNTLAICESCKSKDKRIKIIHQQHSGQSAARNLGVKAATGDYVMFVDSDDWLAGNAVDELIQAIQNDGSEIAVGNYSQFDEKSQHNITHIDVNKDAFSKCYSVQEWFRQ